LLALPLLLRNPATTPGARPATAVDHRRGMSSSPRARIKVYPAHRTDIWLTDHRRYYMRARFCLAEAGTAAAPIARTATSAASLVSFSGAPASADHPEAGRLGWDM
jgi:hypothetical protein